MSILTIPPSKIRMKKQKLDDIKLLVTCWSSAEKLLIVVDTIRMEKQKLNDIKLLVTCWSSAEKLLIVADNCCKVVGQVLKSC